MRTVKLEEDLTAIQLHIRKQLFLRHASGVDGLRRAFDLADADRSGCLDRREFAEALNYAGVFLSTQEVGTIFRAYDADASGGISYEEFVDGIVPPLDAERARLVDLAFQQVDRDGSGVISVDELRRAYNPQSHPLVQSGELSAEAALSQLLDAFDGSGDGRVSKAEFVRFYRNLSYTIPSDEFFVRHMELCWGFRANPVAEEEERVVRLARVIRAKVLERTSGQHFEHETLRKLFARMDGDDSGCLSRDELARALEFLGLPLSRADLAAIFTMFDHDGSGRITWAEFVRFVYADELAA